LDRSSLLAGSVLVVAGAQDQHIGKLAQLILKLSKLLGVAYINAEVN
jgi:hypothetical protein